MSSTPDHPTIVDTIMDAGAFAESIKHSVEQHRKSCPFCSDSSGSINTSRAEKTCSSCDHPATEHDHYGRCFYLHLTSNPDPDIPYDSNLCRCGW